MADKCMIPGDGDIIGPGVRISSYIQGFLAIFNAILFKEKSRDSTNLGLITILSLIISALTQYNTKGLHDLFLIEVSQLTVIYLNIAAAAIVFGIKNPIGPILFYIINL